MRVSPDDGSLRVLPRGKRGLDGDGGAGGKRLRGGKEEETGEEREEDSCLRSLWTTEKRSVKSEGRVALERKPSGLNCLPFELFPNGDENMYASKYIEVCTIGGGTYGQVLKVEPRALPCTSPPLGSSDMSKRQKRGENALPNLAVKKIDLRRIYSEHNHADVKRMKQEAAMIKTLDHVNIVKTFEVYESPSFLWEVMELCDGGDLYERPVAPSSGKQNMYNNGHKDTRKESFLPPRENDVRFVMASILESLAYLHARHIAHRDLKPDNFLWSGRQNCVLKLLDFGLANYVNEKDLVLPNDKLVLSKYDKTAEGKDTQNYVPGKNFQTLRTRAGSLHFVAPEIILGAPHQPYGCQCDLWSVGVILFFLLSQSLPFEAPSDPIILELMVHGDLKLLFRNRYIQPRSQGCKDFLCKLLERNPVKRMTAEGALTHLWIRGSQEISNLSIFGGGNFSTTHLTSIVKSLCRYHSAPILKKLALLFIAKVASLDSTKSSLLLFRFLDKKRLGVLSVDGLYEGLQKLLTHLNHSLPSDYLREVIQSIDLDHTGRIEVSKFIAASLPRQIALAPDLIDQAFDKLDTGRSGEIQVSDLTRFLNKAQTVHNRGPTDLTRGPNSERKFGTKYDHKNTIYPHNQTEHNGNNIATQMQRHKKTQEQTTGDSTTVDTIRDAIREITGTGSDSMSKTQFHKMLKNIFKEEIKCSYAKVSAPSPKCSGENFEKSDISRKKAKNVVKATASKAVKSATKNTLKNEQINVQQNLKRFKTEIFQNENPSRIASQPAYDIQKEENWNKDEQNDENSKAHFPSRKKPPLLAGDLKSFSQPIQNIPPIQKNREKLFSIATILEDSLCSTLDSAICSPIKTIPPPTSWGDTSSNSAKSVPLSESRQVGFLAPRAPPNLRTQQTARNNPTSARNIEKSACNNENPARHNDMPARNSDNCARILENAKPALRTPQTVGPKAAHSKSTPKYKNTTSPSMNCVKKAEKAAREKARPENWADRPKPAKKGTQTARPDGRSSRIADEKNETTDGGAEIITANFRNANNKNDDRGSAARKDNQTNHTHTTPRICKENIIYQPDTPHNGTNKLRNHPQSEANKNILPSRLSRCSVSSDASTIVDFSYGSTDNNFPTKNYHHKKDTAQSNRTSVISNEEEQILMQLNENLRELKKNTQQISKTIDVQKSPPQNSAPQISTSHVCAPQISTPQICTPQISTPIPLNSPPQLRKLGSPPKYSARSSLQNCARISGPQNITRNSAQNIMRNSAQTSGQNWARNAAQNPSKSAPRELGVNEKRLVTRATPVPRNSAPSLRRNSAGPSICAGIGPHISGGQMSGVPRIHSGPTQEPPSNFEENCQKICRKGRNPETDFRAKTLRPCGGTGEEEFWLDNKNKINGNEDHNNTNLINNYNNKEYHNNPNNHNYHDMVDNLIENIDGHAAKKSNNNDNYEGNSSRGNPKIARQLGNLRSKEQEEKTDQKSAKMSQKCRKIDQKITGKYDTPPYDIVTSANSGANSVPGAKGGMTENVVKIHGKISKDQKSSKLSKNLPKQTSLLKFFSSSSLDHVDLPNVRNK